MNMGMTSDNVARDYHVTRNEQVMRDEWLMPSRTNLLLSPIARPTKLLPSDTVSLNKSYHFSRNYTIANYSIHEKVKEGRGKTGRNPLM